MSILTRGERMEIAIYRFVEVAGRGQGRIVSLHMLVELVPESENVDVIDALLRMHDQGFLLLDKYIGGPVDWRPWGAYPQTQRTEFFYQGDFRITVAPKGRLDLERRELAGALPAVTGQGSSKNKPRVYETAFSRYEEQGQIGQGGTGIVRRVIDEGGTAYALKTLRKEHATGDRLRRFRNELHFCTKANHENIIEVIDWGIMQDGGVALPFFVMQLFPTTLHNMMRDHKIGPDSVVRWFNKLVNGIAEAHRLGVCHRDIKPQNVLCDPSQDILVVSDFGISHFAQPMTATLVETSTGERLANWDYAAPEQHSPGRVNEKADIWALGLILNQMFTGTIPAGKDHRLIATVVPELGYLDELVDRMMQHSPERRPDIIEVRETLRAGRATPRTETKTSKTEPTTGIASVDNDHATIDSHVGWVLRIARHSTDGPVLGLACSAINDRAINVQGFSISVRDARSFDSKRMCLRAGFGFKNVNLLRYNELLAGDGSQIVWLIRVNGRQLEVGDTVGQGVLKWPKGDISEREIWQLTLCIESHGVDPWQQDVRVIWERESNRIGVESVLAVGA
jgi:serine/threonine protein kinase